MWKYYLVALLIFSGCSNLTFNAKICGEIASDPQAVMPQECRAYDEEEIQKAFERTKDKIESKEDIVEFTKE